MPEPISLAQQRLALISTLADINREILILKTRDRRDMSPDQIAKLDRMIGIGTAARYRAQEHLSILKEQIKADNIRVQAELRTAGAERKRAAAVAL